MNDQDRKRSVATTSVVALVCALGFVVGCGGTDDAAGGTTQAGTGTTAQGGAGQGGAGQGGASQGGASQGGASQGGASQGGASQGGAGQGGANTGGGGNGECAEGDTQACYTGPAETKDVGQCRAGSRSCSDGKWGACEDEVLPGNEECNGWDDDCNGKSDDGDDLCAGKSEGTACVLGSPHNFCGCNQNSDCSPGNVCCNCNNNTTCRPDDGGGNGTGPP